MKNILPLVLFLAFAAGAGGQEPARFTIETPAETRSECMLVSLSHAAGLAFEHAGARTIAKQFVEIRQDGSKLPALLTSNFVSLSNGDRLPLDPTASVKLAASRLHVWPDKSLPGAHEKGLNLFAPHVVLLFWSLPDGVDAAAPFFKQLQDEPRKLDAVYLKNGDRLDGTVTALSAEAGCVTSADGKKIQTAWSKLAGIAFSTDRQARLRTKKAYLHCVLDGGARVNFLDLRFDKKARVWIGKAQFSAALEVPEASMIAIDVRQGPAVDLADLRPARYEHRAYLGAAWPLVKDAAVSGRPLRLGRETYEKGLGTHAACRVVYQLAGKYQRFDAIVGIDDKAPKGRARAAIEIDGKRIELNDGKELTSQTAPITVRMDVKKARTLTLIVEFGSFGDVQAHVNWANARLIKKD